MCTVRIVSESNNIDSFTDPQTNLATTLRINMEWINVTQFRFNYAFMVERLPPVVFTPRAIHLAVYDIGRLQTADRG